MVTVKTLVRSVSDHDHAPLVLNDGQIVPKVNRPFRFELSWFTRAYLFDVVSKAWQGQYVGNTYADIVQQKLRKARQVLKGWNFNYEGFFRKNKKIICDKIEEIDRRSEDTGLSLQDYQSRNTLQKEYNHIIREDEIKWMQRAKEVDLLQGDNNTSYFMAKASGRKRKTKIFQLHQEEGIIQGDKEVLLYATKFYKELFGPVELLPISLPGK